VGRAWPPCCWLPKPPPPPFPLPHDTGEGIRFSYGGRIANTLTSHCLLGWVRDTYGAAVGDAAMERLFGFYFEREGDLADAEGMLAAVAPAGEAAEAGERGGGGSLPVLLRPGCRR
jgi:hypothetical protein